MIRFTRPHSLLSPVLALLTGALLMSGPSDGVAAEAAPKVRMKTSDDSLSCPLSIARVLSLALCRSKGAASSPAAISA